MIVPFTKMQGIGNDFVVVDAISQALYLNQGQISQLAHRNFGIGFDQLLLIEAPQHPEADFHFRIFNADGSEAGHCGNGARAVAKYVRQKGLTWKRELRLSTNTATMNTVLEDNGLITINMGKPRLEPEKIPLRFAEASDAYAIEVDGIRHKVGAVSMGNPHCVLTVDNIATAPVQELGPKLSQHSYFPAQANVGFMQIVNPEEIKLRVFERGVGETLACGTGACAAVVVGRLQNLLKEKVKVGLPGGSLWIRWEGKGHQVYMTGPAKVVFEGQIDI
ncbi:diaminopimelate epimerase [Kangiella sediminilitoris]|uniref:Diaminopimelate epimerase n=1 Tax=Kangiella sediminilitoris TaxID=1144748 RepID=A0A1B3B7R8_9GAMM|nr:diaminopimelate epimerase [Kangiella sediminilitoris]AOE48840.1 Diaminopimelate epimerase [Kangiella sediminilitoris]